MWAGGGGGGVLGGRRRARVFGVGEVIKKVCPSKVKMQCFLVYAPLVCVWRARVFATGDLKSPHGQCVCTMFFGLRTSGMGWWATFGVGGCALLDLKASDLKVRPGKVNVQRSLIYAPLVCAGGLKENNFSRKHTGFCINRLTPAQRLMHSIISISFTSNNVTGTLQQNRI